MTKIGVISDTHGNLRALSAILTELIDKEKVDEILHLGDIVDIGPDSYECFRLLKSLPNTTLLMGNHDKDLAMNDYIAKHLSHVPTEHKQRVFADFSEGDRKCFAALPVYAERICGGQKLQFVHYAYDRNNPPKCVADVDFCWIQQHPTAENLDETFASFDGAAVFFGHKHEPCDIRGKMLYVDVGSVGCHPEPLACGVVIEYDEKTWTYRRIAVPYDMESTHREILKLPYGEQIYDFYYLRKHITY